MKNLILCANLFPGPAQERFLAAEVPYLKMDFGKIYVQRYETTLSPYYTYYIQVHNLPIKSNLQF